MTQRPIDKTPGFRAASARLVSIAYRMLGSRAEAEDVVQEAWLKWHTADVDALDEPLAWLTTVTTRLAIDRLRRLRSERDARTREWLAEPWLENRAPSAEDEASRTSSFLHGLALLFEKLSPDQRAVFVLHEAFDCDYEQISDVVGKTPSHCRQLMHRARARLQRKADLPFDPTHLATRMQTIECLRTAIETCDETGAMRLFAQSTVLVTDALDAPPVTTASLAAQALIGSAAALAGRGMVRAETLVGAGGLCIALMRGLEIVGLVGVSFAGVCIGRIHLLTDAARLREVNEAFGASAVARLLARVRASCIDDARGAENALLKAAPA
ncbi:sigma-70 family RNA polymerase sigma factor [Trinickia fusca]|uniref:Sigma-70 family RNA polymerase sigma factor n=1 Tax=Trinickia fusca TaxID=2419777 RepID=A0A494XGM6_9BURK|nr:sigma-70 family RNA polymerase sigma factor [Trinickia fusca]RKP49002.1 sigma-70 family RNA polymerase sigma factor [Trinickia fusca]